MALPHLGDLARGALAGAFLGTVVPQVAFGAAGLTMPTIFSYALSALGAVGGAVVMWRAPPKEPEHPLPTEPNPKLVEVVRKHRDWQKAHLRRAVEPHAIRPGISPDVLISAYSEINAEMKRVGAA